MADILNQCILVSSVLSSISLKQLNNCLPFGVYRFCFEIELTQNKCATCIPLL